MTKFSDDVYERLFLEARTCAHWLDKPVDESQLREAYALMRMGPTSANCCPTRLVFITTDEGRARLRPHLIESNIEKTMTAPATIIVAYDSEFYERVPELHPHNPGARDWFTGSDESIYENAMRNGSLQGGYLIIALRSLGLDCGPMSGFDPAGVNGEFFPDGRFKANFLLNTGYGDYSEVHPRLPRLDFEDACKIV
ncbi:MAG: malonic semialdehyde reductase [Pseudomonadota bacterium]